MSSARTAFSMIELIFVIVVLGLLAAVALPKITATRDDAMASKVALNVMTAAGEIASYAMSNGETVNDMIEMSNAIASLDGDGTATLDNANKKATVKFGTVADCVVLKVNSGATDENLTVSFGATNGDSKCENLQALIDAKKYPMQLRGQLVK